MEVVGPLDAITVQSTAAGASGCLSAHHASMDASAAPIIISGRAHSRLFDSLLFGRPGGVNRMEANGGEPAN